MNEHWRRFFSEFFLFHPGNRHSTTGPYSPPPEKCGNKAAHYESGEGGRFIPDPALGRLQNKGIKLQGRNRERFGCLKIRNFVILTCQIQFWWKYLLGKRPIDRGNPKAIKKKKCFAKCFGYVGSTCGLDSERPGFPNKAN
jgi:hypothetical protein